MSDMELKKEQELKAKENALQKKEQLQLHSLIRPNFGLSNSEMGAGFPQLASPTKRAHPLSELRRVLLQERLVWVWLVAALLPFAVIRAYMFYGSGDFPHDTMEALRSLQAIPGRLSHGRLPLPTMANSASLSNSRSMEKQGIPTSLANSTGMDAHIDNSSLSNSKTIEEFETGTSPKGKEVQNAIRGEVINGINNKGSIEEPKFNNVDDTKDGYQGRGGGKNTTSGDVTSSNNEKVIDTQAVTSHTNSTTSVAAGTCNLSEGTWVPDSRPPPYTNETCLSLQGHQNCMKNGRPDSGYLYWKWKPKDCELPQINDMGFLESMRGKTMAFVGDSIARNQFQSLLCAWTQVDHPTHIFHTDDDRFNRWLFPSYSFTLGIYWSPYLVKQTDKEMVVNNITQSVPQVDLGVLDDYWVREMANVDVLVISTGQWYFKTVVYLDQGNVTGCHYCPGVDLKEVGYSTAYRKALQTVLKGVLTLPGYRGVTLLRTFAPDHFEKGRWNDGGSCPRTVPGGVPLSDVNKLMHDVEVEVFRNFTKDVGPGIAARFKLVDTTNLANLRPDGHPGPYRSYQPFSKEFVGPLQMDCLHWCLPGPIDAWNEVTLETWRQALQ